MHKVSDYINSPLVKEATNHAVRENTRPSDPSLPRPIEWGYTLALYTRVRVALQIFFIGVS